MIFPKIQVGDNVLKPKQVLFFYETPILFVCENIKKELFLVYCSDIDELQYTIALIEKKSLIEMLENFVSMDCLFISASGKWIADVVSFKEICYARNVDSFDVDSLPKKDAKYGALDESVQSFLQQLKEETYHLDYANMIVRKELVARFVTWPKARRLRKIVNFVGNDECVCLFSSNNAECSLKEKKSLWTIKESYEKEELCPA